MLFLTPTAAASCFDGWTGEHAHFGGEGGLDGSDQTLTQGPAVSPAAASCRDVA